MISRFATRYLRKIVAFLLVCGAASLAVHSVFLGLRRSITTTQSREQRRGNIRLLREQAITPAVIPNKYLENISNISAHNFKYLIRPQDKRRCLGEREWRNDGAGKNENKEYGKLLILFMVHSAASNFQHRMAIRETWGSVGKRLTRLIFLLGNPVNSTLQGMLTAEHQQFGDLVQEDFVEVYRNITLKNVMGLKWASKQCPRAKYVVKTDDDMFINSGMLISALINSRLPRKDLILCKIHFFKDVPREGKYRIEKSMYSADYWPSFCFGGCWIASMDVVHKLYDMSLQTRQIYLDDVYVTGILRTKLALPLNYISRAYMIFCHTRGNYMVVRDMWKALQESKKRYKVSREKQEPYVKYWATCFK